MKQHSCRSGWVLRSFLPAEPKSVLFSSENSNFSPSRIFVNVRLVQVLRPLEGLGLPSQQPWRVLHHSFKNVTLFPFKLPKTESFGVTERQHRDSSIEAAVFTQRGNRFAIRSAPEFTHRVVFTVHRFFFPEAFRFYLVISCT